MADALEGILNSYSGLLQVEVYPELFKDMRPFAWSPPNPETQDFWDMFPIARLLVDWNPTDGKAMVLPSDTGQKTARHEFGHVLGLGDMYDDPNLPLIGLPGTFPQWNGVQAYTKRPGGTDLDYDAVMDNGMNVAGKDIEMVILAFQTGRRQNFQKQGGFGVISQAMLHN